MAHPFHHAVSSEKKFGGDRHDYVKVHSWFDSSKEALADARHRQVLHHSFGIFLAEKKFGLTIRNSSNRDIPVRVIAEQHVVEDAGFIPSVHQAYVSMSEEAWMTRNQDADTPERHATHSAHRFGGEPEDFVAVHATLEGSRKHLPDARHRMILHHTFGVSVVESIHGPSLTLSDETTVPVREVLEEHIRQDLGFVPTLEEAFDSMALESWMSRGARALSHELGRRMPGTYKHHAHRHAGKPPSPEKTGVR